MSNRSRLFYVAICAAVIIGNPRHASCLRTCRAGDSRPVKRDVRRKTKDVTLKQGVGIGSDQNYSMAIPKSGQLGGGDSNAWKHKQCLLGRGSSHGMMRE